jgi:hypothetical protein
MEEKSFKIRSYGFGELAQLYLPDIHPKSASNQLRHWFQLNNNLSEALNMNGYRKGNRILTPNQVKVIVEFLGEP